MVVLQRARAQGAETGHAAFAQWRADLRAGELRQRELVECALDEAALRALLAPLGDPSPSLRVLEFEREGIAGWAAVARRG
jgi:hypothetical protein